MSLSEFISLKGQQMKQNIVHIALVVKEYDEAIDFYVNKLQFELI